jgi:signal-transduction protein with cAMP-binding, CBS, and nucleotidyltransferase domain
MQSKVIRSCFKFNEFLTDFKLFFDGCQENFINYVVVHMYARRYEGYEDVIKCKQNVNEVYFIQEGRVVIRQDTGVKSAFCLLEKNSFFGEYHCLNNKLAKFTYTVISEDGDIDIDDLKLDKIKNMENRKKK